MVSAFKLQALAESNSVLEYGGSVMVMQHAAASQINNLF